MYDFGKNTLLKRVEELELLLERKKRENEDMEAALNRFREQEDFQQRSFREIRLAMEEKLKELDDRILEFEQEKKREELRMEAEKAQMRQRLKEEADTARSAVKLEIEEEKKRAREALKEQIRSFQLSYSRQIAKIQAQMELLTQESIREITSESVQPEESLGQIQAKNIKDLPKTGATVMPGEEDNERVERVISLLGRNGGKEASG